MCDDGQNGFHLLVGELAQSEQCIVSEYAVMGTRFLFSLGAVR